MARTSLTPAAMIRNSGVAGTAADIDQANGMTVDGANPDKTVLAVSNTGTAGNAIVRAGTDKYPAWTSGQGDITAPVAAAGTSYLGPFDSARVGDVLNVDFDSGVAGTIEAIQLP